MKSKTIENLRFAVTMVVVGATLLLIATVGLISLPMAIMHSTLP